MRAFCALSACRRPLIDAADEGMTTVAIRSLFAELRRELMPLVRAISAQPMTAMIVCMALSASGTAEFSLAVVKRFGYDLERGRLDKTTILSAPNSPQATSGLPPVSTKITSGCAVLDHA